MRETFLFADSCQLCFPQSLPGYALGKCYVIMVLWRMNKVLWYNHLVSTEERWWNLPAWRIGSGLRGEWVFFIVVVNTLALFWCCSTKLCGISSNCMAVRSTKSTLRQKGFFKISIKAAGVAKKKGRKKCAVSCWWKKDYLGLWFNLTKDHCGVWRGVGKETFTNP